MTLTQLCEEAKKENSYLDSMNRSLQIENRELKNDLEWIRHKAQILGKAKLFDTNLYWAKYDALNLKLFDIPIKLQPYFRLPYFDFIQVRLLRIWKKSEQSQKT